MGSSARRPAALSAIIAVHEEGDMLAVVAVWLDAADDGRFAGTVFAACLWRSERRVRVGVGGESAASEGVDSENCSLISNSKKRCFVFVTVFHVSK